MPAYNCAHYVREAIESILAQSYEHFEFLICDDCSDDATGTILSSVKDSRIRLFRNDTNQGYLQTVNRLFGECRGAFIAFQDADDWSSSDRLHKQLSMLSGDSSLSLCGTDIEKVHAGKSVPAHYPTTYTGILDALKSGRTSLFCGASIMFRQSLLEDIGPFRTFFDRIGAEDIDWYLRVIETHKAGNIAEPLYFYRQLPNSLSKTAKKDLLSYFSADIALALHLQRMLADRESIDLDGEQARRIVVEALRLDDAQRQETKCAIREQASYLNLGAALSILGKNRKNLGLGMSLIMLLTILITCSSVYVLPASILNRIAARSRLRRARLLAGAMA